MESCIAPQPATVVARAALFSGPLCITVACSSFQATQMHKPTKYYPAHKEQDAHPHGRTADLGPKRRQLAAK